MKWEGWKNIFHANSNQKRAGLAILISDKVDIKSYKVTKDKEGHYILIKGSVEQEDITIINICAPNDRLSKYMKQKWAEFEGRNREF